MAKFDLSIINVNEYVRLINLNTSCIVIPNTYLMYLIQRKGIRANVEKSVMKGNLDFGPLREHPVPSGCVLTPFTYLHK